MSDGRNLICTFDSTFDGFLTAVHYTIVNRIRPIQICAECNAQLFFGCEILFIPTDNTAADLVRNALCDKVGYDGFKRAYYAFLCSRNDAVMTSYTYILYAFKYGKKLYNYRAVEDIDRAYKLEHKVSHEADRMKGFLRFSVMEGGVQYATMEPDNDILPLIMPHFADRLKAIPFVIHDLSRKTVGVCAHGRWFITSAEGITPPKLSSDENQYRKLWQSFYNAISIKERKNTRLQTQLMPKKYRKQMTEHNSLFDNQ